MNIKEFNMNIKEFNMTRKEEKEVLESAVNVMNDTADKNDLLVYLANNLDSKGRNLIFKYLEGSEELRIALLENGHLEL
ncbi:TPA: hypothetical protein LA460_000282 [Clostridium botulinum]|nr:hypothetical protein [Clostridium botulinum]HBJ1652886.1 hypothetical protein [Clostridium botulinum]